MAVCMTAMTSELYFHGRSDPEFYLPEHTQVEAILSLLPTVPLRRLGTFNCSAFYPAATHLYSENGMPFLRCVDIVDFPLISSDQPFARIPQPFVLANPTIRTLSAGDIVISKVGTPCYAALLAEDMPIAAMTRTVLGMSGIRQELINPHYLIAFLRSRYGFDQMMRERELTIQYQLTLDRTRKVRVYLPDRPIQDEIGNTVQAYYKSLRQGIEAYEEAQQLLESELGLDEISFRKPVGYTARFSEAIDSGRIDADFFQIQFRQIDDHLDKCTTVQLHTLVDITKGIEVGSSAYQPAGHPFLRVSNIKETGIELGPSDKYISPALYSVLQSYHPQIGELLLTKDGSPGIAMSVDQGCDGIISGGIVRLKPKTHNIPNEYLALVINSRSCRMQIDRECSGALILHWKPASIRKLRIPILAEAVMYKIAKLVTEAKLARRKTVELLEQAKSRVEQLIEEAVKS
jgi:restriction endonuclease S subunit